MLVLEISQIIYNFVVSFAIIVVTILISIIACDLIKFIKSTKNLLKSIAEESCEIHDKINKFLEGIFRAPFVAKFFKRRNKKNNN